MKNGDGKARDSLVLPPKELGTRTLQYILGRVQILQGCSRHLWDAWDQGLGQLLVTYKPVQVAYQSREALRDCLPLEERPPYLHQ